GEKLDFKLLACLCIDELLIAHLVAGFFEQAQGLTKIITNGVRITSDWIGIGFGEDFGRDLVPHGFEQFKFFAGRKSSCGEFGALEIAVDALVLAEEDFLVHLLEVKSIVEGEANARILELASAQVEGEGLHQADIVDRELLEYDAFLSYRRKIVGGGPVLGAVLHAPIHQIALEGLNRDRSVAEIFVSQLVEIIPANIDVDTFAPIAFDALVNNIVGGREFLDFIRAAAKRHFERSFLDAALFAVLVGAFPPVFRQNGELSDNLRQLAAASAVERERDITLASFFCLQDVAIACTRLGTYFLERIEGENDVVRCYRLAVLPYCLGTKSKGDRRDILRKTHGFGEKPIRTGYFIERLHHQRVVDLVDALSERAFDASDHQVEIVVRAETDLRR